MSNGLPIGFEICMTVLATGFLLAMWAFCAEISETVFGVIVWTVMFAALGYCFIGGVWGAFN